MPFLYARRDKTTIVTAYGMSLGSLKSVTENEHLSLGGLGDGLNCGATRALGIT